MIDFRLRLGLWWARVRLRWRRRARKLEAAHALDAAVTSGLVIAGVLTATSHVEDSTKLSLGILLGVVELVFLFGRLILREMRKLAARIFAVLPDDLPVTLFHHLDGERLGLLTRARELSQSMVCDLEKHEMYAELIGLTDTVTTVKSGTLGAAIYAVSGTNIEDFQREVLAKEYLDANARAVAKQVTVRRLFLLDGNQVHSPRVAAIMRMHETALQAKGSIDSGVKWLLKTNAGGDSDLDFALFAHEVLVRQVLRPGGVKAELTVNDTQLAPTLAAFHRLWTHKDARTVADFRVRP
jgi:hypothetical protein